MRNRVTTFLLMSLLAHTLSIASRKTQKKYNTFENPIELQNITYEPITHLTIEPPQIEYDPIEHPPTRTEILRACAQRVNTKLRKTVCCHRIHNREQNQPATCCEKTALTVITSIVVICAFTAAILIRTTI